MNKRCVVVRYQPSVRLALPLILRYSWRLGYSILLILIYNRIRLSLAAVFPNGPCKNCSLRKKGRDFNSLKMLEE